MSAPSITVLMPVYNAAPYLHESVGSILWQSFGDFELLIIDDGSSDGSADIIRSFSDTRIRFLSHTKNQGLISTLNEGLRIASGKYLARMDADDISHPDRFRIQFDFMENHPEIAVSGTHMSAIGSHTINQRKFSNVESLKAALLFTCVIPHPSVMMRMQTMRDEAWQYDPNDVHCEDFGLWNKMAAKHSLAVLPDVLLNYRLHSEQVSLKHRSVQEQGMHTIRMRILEKMGIRWSQEQESAFRKLMRLEFDFTTEFLVAVEQALLGLSKQNRRAGYVSTLAMDREIGTWWYNLLSTFLKRKVRIPKSTKESPLSSAPFLEPFQRMKLQLKSIIAFSYS